MADTDTGRQASDPASAQEVRLVLFGPAGDGKSATGNTILGKRAFDDNIWATAPDNQCHYAKKVTHGMNIIVVDTPGLIYEGKSWENNQEEIPREIAKSILLSAPGPHAILLVIRMTRLSDRLPRATGLIEDMFGVEAKRYIIIVLTGKDDLEREEETVDDYIANAPSYMSAMFKKFPVFAINNKTDSINKEKQTKELLKVVTELNRTHLSNTLYKTIEEILQRAEGETPL